MSVAEVTIYTSFECFFRNVVKYIRTTRHLFKISYRLNIRKIQNINKSVS